MAQDGDSGSARSSGARRTGKSASAFRTISEVARELELPQHVLRFWETKFDQISPLKRGGGRRYYRPEDIELLTRVRDLLHRDGYTIKGVQKLFAEEESRSRRGSGDGTQHAGIGPDKAALRALIGEMEDHRDKLLAALGR